MLFGKYYDDDHIGCMQPFNQVQTKADIWPPHQKSHFFSDQFKAVHNYMTVTNQKVDLFGAFLFLVSVG